MSAPVVHSNPVGVLGMSPPGANNGSTNNTTPPATNTPPTIPPTLAPPPAANGMAPNPLPDATAPPNASPPSSNPPPSANNGHPEPISAPVVEKSEASGVSDPVKPVTTPSLVPAPPTASTLNGTPPSVNPATTTPPQATPPTQKQLPALVPMATLAPSKPPPPLLPLPAQATPQEASVPQPQQQQTTNSVPANKVSPAVASKPTQVVAPSPVQVKTSPPRPPTVSKTPVVGVASMLVPPPVNPIPVSTSAVVVATKSAPPPPPITPPKRGRPPQTSSPKKEKFVSPVKEEKEKEKETEKTPEKAVKAEPSTSGGSAERGRKRKKEEEGEEGVSKAKEGKTHIEEGGVEAKKKKLTRGERERRSLELPKADDAAEERKSKRSRTQTQPFQVALADLTLLRALKATAQAASQPKANEDKLVVFFKGEFLAVRNAEGSFYVCQALQNIYRNSHRIRIRWLSEDESAEGKGTYTPDFCDHTEFECILTNLELDKLERGRYKLPEEEKKRTENILKRALDVEKGVVEKPAVTEEHPDGLDVSLFHDESQLTKLSKSKDGSDSESDSEEDDDEEGEEEEKAKESKGRKTKEEPKKNVATPKTLGRLRSAPSAQADTSKEGKRRSLRSTAAPEPKKKKEEPVEEDEDEESSEAESEEVSLDEGSDESEDEPVSKRQKTAKKNGPKTPAIKAGKRGRRKSSSPKAKGKGSKK